MSKIYGSATDPLQISYGPPRRLKDRFADAKTAQRIGLLTVFLICKPFPCQSLQVRSRSGYVLGNICWCGSINDERDATRTSRKGIQTIRTLTP